MFYYGLSDVGQKRPNNQDSFIVKSYSSGAVLGIVCDGMGGAAGGKTASTIASEEFCKRMDQLAADLENGANADENTVAEAMLEGVFNANRAVFEKAEADEKLSGMGTTLVASLVMGKRIFTVNVGDSRMYLADGNKIVQVTHDHSYVQYLVDIGKMTEAEAKRSSNKNIITRAIGTEEETEPDIYLTEIKDEEANSEDSVISLLLCTDGLSNHVSPRKMFSVIESARMNEKGEEAPVSIAGELVKLANDDGGSDNITVVVISV